MKKNIFNSLILTLGLSAFLGSGSALAQAVSNETMNQKAASSQNQNPAMNPNVPAQGTVTITAPNSNPQVTKEASQNALQLMDNVVQARSDIHKGNYSGAKDSLNEAQTLLGKVKSEEPAYTVKQRIDIARKKLDYESTSKVIPDLVPIYQELDAVQVYTPTNVTRGHLDKAKRNLQSGNKTMAQQELRLARDSVTVYQAAIPLDQADRDITSAQQYLKNSQPSKADQSLGSLEDSLVVSVNTVTQIPKPTIGQAEKPVAPSTMNHNR